MKNRKLYKSTTGFFNLILLTTLLTSCGKLKELIEPEESNSEKSEADEKLEKQYACRNKHNIYGHYTDGTETVGISPTCQLSTITCGQTGTLTNVTSNSFTLSLPGTNVANCFSGTHECSYSKNGTNFTITCGANVFSYTKT